MKSSTWPWISVTNTIKHVNKQAEPNASFELIFLLLLLLLLLPCLDWIWLPCSKTSSLLFWPFQSFRQHSWDSNLINYREIEPEDLHLNGSLQLKFNDIKRYDFIDVSLSGNMKDFFLLYTEYFEKPIMESWQSVYIYIERERERRKKERKFW